VISLARQRMGIRRLLSLLLLISLMISFIPAGSARASGVLQTNGNTALAQLKLGEMTPEEKVGQLFLVTFTGASASEKTQIYDLIVHHHIGGVVLRSENDNFVATPDTVSDAYQLIAQLQDDERQASLNQPSAREQVRLLLYLCPQPHLRITFLYSPGFHKVATAPQTIRY